MNAIELYVYNLVRRSPKLKQIVRNLYQSAFDILPRKKEYYCNKLQYKEGYFFGFHDVSSFSTDDTKILACHNLFDLRMPYPGEGIEVGYFDFTDGVIGDFHQIGTSYAWNFHKGCRLQWLDDARVIYNTMENNRIISKIVNVNSRVERVVNYPIDAIYTTTTKALATSFSYERLERCMPGYGYPYEDCGLTDQVAPKGTGLFLLDLNTGERKLLVSLAELASYSDKSYMKDYLHFVTHSEFSKDGRYISFFYRWIPSTGNYMKRYTKFMVYDLHTNKLIDLPTQESGSHYVWNSKNQILTSCIINGKNCHVLYDMNDIEHYQIIAGNILNSDGHQSFITDTSFVTDTYPDKFRMAKIYKVDVITQEVELLISVYSSKEFQTKDFKCHIACDLHPRVSFSGKYLCFDSPRTGKRGLYVMAL